jgi:hypothetical protein
MHRTSRQHYISGRQRVWRICCEQCGVLAENLENIADVFAVESGHHSTRYLRTGPASGVPTTIDTGRSKIFCGTTHILDVAAGETLCSTKNLWSHTDFKPDLATCITCWAEYHSRRSYRG